MREPPYFVSGLLVVLVTAGVSGHAWGIHRHFLWLDEAESGISGRAG